MSEPTLLVSELFLSIQGESTHAGWPCAFVRTAGCPLRCAWCDTTYAYEGGEELALSEILERVEAFGVGHVEVTGGEPLVQAATLPLVSALCDRGLTVLLETSGALDISGVDPRVHRIVDIKCPASGMAERNLWTNIDELGQSDEVKLVLASRGDYEYARGLIEEHRLVERCPVLLSTAFDRLAPREVVRWMLEDRLPVRFQLQQHKIIWPPEARGV